MKFFHHNLEIELDDEWWTEADMEDFVPKSKAYRVDLDAARGRTVFEIRIDEVRPLKRNPGVGIFNDNAEASAKSRVVSILRGFISSKNLRALRAVGIKLNQQRGGIPGWGCQRPEAVIPHVV